MNRPLPPHPLRALLRDERGLTTVEYVIVLCLMAVVAVATWQKFGHHMHDYLKKADTKITTELKKKP